MSLPRRKADLAPVDRHSASEPNPLTKADLRSALIDRRPYRSFSPLKFTLLGTNLYQLKPNGDYALYLERELIRIAFSREDAARALAYRLARARPRVRAVGPGSGRSSSTFRRWRKSGPCCRLR